MKLATFGQLLKIFGATFERYPSNLCKTLQLALFVSVSGETSIVLSVENPPFSNLDGNTIH